MFVALKSFWAINLCKEVSVKHKTRQLTKYRTQDLKTIILILDK